MTGPVLAATDVTVGFGGLVALDGVDLAVGAGEITGLVGPNGAGKTTMFNVLSGLLRPSTGRVTLEGRDITRTSPQRRARLGLARTFQRAELFRELTVREHLTVAHRVHRHRVRLWRDVLVGARPPDAEERRAVGSLLEALGLTDVADLRVTALPLGTGRLVEVGRALATEPRVVLLDEPSSGLDEQETDQLSATLDRLRTERGTSFVLVEHDVEMVLSLSDHLVVLDFGEVIASGAPAHVRELPEVRAAYLGTAVEG